MLYSFLFFFFSFHYTFQRSLYWLLPSETNVIEYNVVSIGSLLLYPLIRPTLLAIKRSSLCNSIGLQLADPFCTANAAQLCPPGDVLFLDGDISATRGDVSCMKISPLLVECQSFSLETLEKKRLIMLLVR